MLPRRRLLLTLGFALLVALPAGVLAGLCVGNACQRSAPGPGRVPFCSLPRDVRSLVAAGFRDGRSPHVLALTDGVSVIGSSANDRLLWPSVKGSGMVRVPMVFAGTGVSPSAVVPVGTTLDTVAPTLAEIIGLRRPHPGVRSGEPVPGLASGQPPRLVVLVAWKRVSSRELERRPQDWPVLRGLIEDGAATLEATPGSIPFDPAATLTTIGTGGLPSNHGITGALVRNDRGAVVPAWGEEAPFSVIAALGDDLDEAEGQSPRIGLIATDGTDRGLIGGNWYLEHDRDDVVIEAEPERQAAAAEELLATGYGGDDVTDLLAVAMEGPVPKLDRALARILVGAKNTSNGSVALAVTSTGTSPSGPDVLRVRRLEADVASSLGADVIEASALGGLFLDQDLMTESGLSDDRVVSALRAIESSDGERVFADVFPSIAVTFARYC